MARKRTLNLFHRKDIQNTTKLKVPRTTPLTTPRIHIVEAITTAGVGAVTTRTLGITKATVITLRTIHRTTRPRITNHTLQELELEGTNPVLKKRRRTGSSSRRANKPFF
jgi:hypothetical protein